MEGQIYFDMEKFISIVQIYPVLWDKNNDKYRNMQERANSWESVMIAMCSEETVESWTQQKKKDIVDELKNKWKNLRKSFSRELAKRKKCRSGSARTWKTYIYFEQMEFLVPKTISSFQSVDDDENEVTSDDNEEIYVDEPAPLKNEEETNHPSTKIRMGEISEGSRKRKREENNSENEVSLLNDPDRMFLLSLIGDFKKVPENKKAEVKVALINAISSGLQPYPPPHQYNHPPTPH